MVGLGVPELLIICMIPLLFVVVIAGIGALVWWMSRRGNTAVTMSAASRETPLDILKARYARGELTQEQFEQMKRDLEG